MTVVRRLHEPPTKAATSAVEKTLRRVLVSLAGRERLSNDDLEALFERVDAELRTLPKGSWVFDVLDRVVGKSAKRKRDAIFVLVTLAAAPGGEARLLRYVNDENPAARLEVIGAIHRQRWLHLAPLLAERLGRETDPSCRNALIVACGDLRVPETLDALLTVAERDRKEQTDERHRILFQLRKHASKRARPYFEAMFDVPLPESSPPSDGSKELKVLAAWGLLALGAVPKAHAFLVAMLDDVRIVHVREGKVSGVEPGLSERAAQALADVHHLPFRWGRGDAAKIKAHLRRTHERGGDGDRA